MADPQHLAIIRQGVEQWNANRPTEPNLIGADLSEANLIEADLHGANLNGADLNGANLHGANLHGANLNGANLHVADLHGANLHGANLHGADLRVANLRVAYLRGADLSGANLSGADLHGANLSGADLRVAYLRGADLSGANLHGADLSGADLSGADLRGADLSGADLRVANLSRANLHGADLSGADLSGARCEATAWVNIDLSNVIGLSDVAHLGPSSIGVDTLYLSEGRIPAVFLRGCGLPDYFVGMVPGLTVTAPIQHFSAFISYSHSDQIFTRKLYDHLFHERKVPIWLDEHEIEPGDLIMKSVDRAIRRMDKVVLLCSEASLNSWWVREEIERWTDRERELTRKTGESVSMVIPVDLDGHLWDSDHEYAVTIRKAKVLDARRWDTDPSVAVEVNDRLHRALRRDKRSPVQLLQDQAGLQP